MHEYLLENTHLAYRQVVFSIQTTPIEQDEKFFIK